MIGSGAGLSLAQQADGVRPSAIWTLPVGSHLDLVVARDTAAMIAETEGTIIAGTATAPRPDRGITEEFWLQRRDGDGDVVWSGLYGGEESVVSDLVRAGPRETAITSGYVVVGSVGGDERAAARIVKTEDWSENDSFGGPEIDWEWTDDSDTDSGFAAVATGPSGFAAAGTTDGVPSIVAFDAGGNERWAETYDVFETDARASVQALVSTDDGNFAMLIGNSPKCPGKAIEVVVVDSTDGKQVDVWSYDAGTFRDVVRTGDGYAFGGWTEGDGSSADFLLTATDANGIRQWTETYGGPTEDDADIATDLVRTGDGYVLGGERVNVAGDDRSVQLVHTDRDGEQRWATVVDDDTEMQHYTAAAIGDGYVYVLGTRGQREQLTLWKLVADDLVASEDNQTSNNDNNKADETVC